VTDQIALRPSQQSVADGIGYPVPDLAWMRLPILQGIKAAREIPIIPTIKGASGYIQPVQCLFGGQMGAFNQFDNLKV
jgi:hypothetical protein